MRVEKKQQNELVFKQWFKVMLIFVSLFTFLVSVLTLYRTFNKDRTIDEIKYMYDVNNTIDYKVHLYDNSFFEEPYLGMDKQYTAKLIDNISIEVLNSISVSKISNIEYDYAITATIDGSYQNDMNSLNNELWNRRFVLVNHVNKIVNNVSRNEITVPIDIDYQYYKDYVTEFQKQLRLDIDAILKVDLIIDYRFYVEGDKVSKRQITTVNIPLTDPTFKINVDLPEPINEITFIEVEQKNNIVKIIGSIILLISSFFCGIALLILFYKDTKKTEFVLKLNKILKDYGDIIAETINMPNLEGQEVLELKVFTDLIDIEEELKIPIIYYEKVKNKEGWFMLNHGRQTYIYVLKEKTKKNVRKK